MHQIDLIIQRIEHTLGNEDELRSAEALRSCLEDVHRIAAGRDFSFNDKA